ncbi:MAG: molybdopterin cofactor-binding domain-containing protein [Bradymonadales bacterium]|jgi:CO/xanthine dehydrogenase Mo-binding subunit/aerobic-type carbon monoxide dehydrogenase small subunit (CoxS/CutS family)
MPKVSLTINGERRSFEIDVNRRLLELLRDHAAVKSPKAGCYIGECGACSVVMDGRSVNSCLIAAVEAEGHDIKTVEYGDELYAQLQQAFVDFGAIQCGYCTPGMLNSAYALLKAHATATKEQILEAIEGNFCRCTGYESIIDAILAVVSAQPEGYTARADGQDGFVGGSAVRKDAMEKALGTARYVPDMSVEGMLHAKIKVSPHASARIVRIDTSKAEAMEGVRAVLTGMNMTQKLGLYMRDKDILARERVRYQGEPVAAVAADTLDIACRAAAAIEVEYEPLPVVTDVHMALREDSPIVHPDLMSYEWMQGVYFPQANTNIAHHQKIRKGNVDEVFATAKHRYKHHFNNPAVPHVPMEPHGVIVEARRNGEVEIISSAQSPFTVRQLFCHTFSMPEHKVRVQVPYVGGGFGGKAGISIEPLAYCLSKAASYRPIKLLMTREEEFNTTPSRQGMSSTVETAVDDDGKILALRVEYLWDAGAYADYGVNVGRAAAYAGAGPYHIPNCQIDSKVVYTNKLYGTAYRGFGHLEALWGIERNLDIIAKDLGIDPIEIRRRNVLRLGDTTITGELITESHGRPDLCLEKVAKTIDYRENARVKERVSAQTGKHRGIGLALLHKAPAMPTYTSCSALLQFATDGSVTLSISGVDYGQGTYTAIAQIVAEALSIPYEKVRVPWTCDTDFTPYDWQTVASRFIVMGGNAALDAANDCLRQIKDVAAQVFKAPVASIEHGDEHVWVRGKPSVRIPYKKIIMGYVYPDGSAIGGPVIGRGRYIAQGLTNLDPETGQGLPALNWTFGAHAVEVEVDSDTGDITVLQCCSAFDVGKVIHEQNCRGQVVGGVVQGLGSATIEGFIFKDGVLKNPSFVDYKIPTARDIPLKMTQEFVETPHPQGPLGARGVAEHPMISVPSAIGNAIAQATDCEILDLPLNPERVYFALKGGI